MGVVEDVDEEGKEEITESEACSTLHNRSGNS